MRASIRRSASTSASAQSRSIVVVAGRMVRVRRQASTNLRIQVLVRPRLRPVWAKLYHDWVATAVGAEGGRRASPGVPPGREGPRCASRPAVAGAQAPGRGRGDSAAAPAGGGLQDCPVGRPRATAGHELAPAGRSRHRGEDGARSSLTRAAAAVATDGTQPRLRRRRAPCQLAVRRRAPPPSNSSASASAPITGRAGTGVRSATIENCTAAALGLAAPSYAAPAGGPRPGRPAVPTTSSQPGALTPKSRRTMAGEVPRRRSTTPRTDRRRRTAGSSSMSTRARRRASGASRSAVRGRGPVPPVLCGALLPRRRPGPRRAGGVARPGHPDRCAGRHPFRGRSGPRGTGGRTRAHRPGRLDRGGPARRLQPAHHDPPAGARLYRDARVTHSRLEEPGQLSVVFTARRGAAIRRRLGRAPPCFPAGV